MKTVSDVKLNKIIQRFLSLLNGHSHTAADVGVLYGESLPDAGTEGRIFILKAQVGTEQTFSTTSGAYTLKLTIKGSYLSANTMEFSYRLWMTRTAANRFNDRQMGWDIKFNDTLAVRQELSTSSQIYGFSENEYEITFVKGTVAVPYSAEIKVTAYIDTPTDSNGYAPGKMTISNKSVNMDNVGKGGIYVDNGTTWELYR